MKVLRQKNVYYIDLNKNVYKGYIETVIEKDRNDTEIIYKSSGLEIENVKIFNERTTDLQSKKVVAKIKPKNSPENEKISIQNLQNGKIKVSVPESLLEDDLIKIIIEFKSTKSNKSCLWYKPIDQKDRHKEFIASSDQFRNESSCIFPYIDESTSFDLYYIIPNIEEVKVVSSGTFMAIKEEDQTIVYHFSSSTNPKYLSFCVGTYLQIDIFSDSDKKKLFLPSFVEEDEDLEDLKFDLQAIIKYIENFTKTEEMSSTNVLFSLIDTFDYFSKNLIVLKYCLFLRDAETAFLVKKVLSELFSYQVYYFLDWYSCDLWICHGFSGYLSDYCLRYLLGNNDFLYNLRETKKFVIENDIVEAPLFYTLRDDNSLFSTFFKAKSKVVFHCLEAELSFAFLQKISDSLIEEKGKCIKHKENDYLLDKNLYIFTNKFLKIIKDSTGKDLSTFFDFYVFRPGLINIRLVLNIIRKKNLVKIGIIQTATSKLPSSNKTLHGYVEIRSYETEGIFDHILDPAIEENSFTYHSRSKKRKNEEEDEGMPLLYIRADIKNATLYNFIIEQPDYMSIEQLQDKSVIGQIEAVESLSKKPTILSCEALEKMLDNSHLFFKVRVKVMNVLGNILIESNSSELDFYNGMQRLIQYFVRTRCVPNSTILKSNEPGLIPYFIQKHLIKAVSNNRNNSKIILSFLENILKYNDNSLNSVSDSWFISSILNYYSIHSLFLVCEDECDSKFLLERYNNDSTLYNCKSDMKRFQPDDSKSGTERLGSNDNNKLDNTYNTLDGCKSGTERLRSNDNNKLDSNQLDGSKSDMKRLESDNNNKLDSNQLDGSKANIDRLGSNDSMPMEHRTERTFNNQLENTVAELERFRLSDLVFSSNNNILTRTCLICYIRMAINGIIELDCLTLENLTKYPNLFSIRMVAIEGLLLLYPESVKQIITLMNNETVFFNYKVLEIFSKYLWIFHNNSTVSNDTIINEENQYNSLLGNDSFMKVNFVLFLQQNLQFDVPFLDMFYANIKERTTVSVNQIMENRIKSYDVGVEILNRNNLLRNAKVRRIRIGDFEELSKNRFLQDYRIILRRTIKSKSRIIKTRMLVKSIPNKDNLKINRPSPFEKVGSSLIHRIKSDCNVRKVKYMIFMRKLCVFKNIKASNFNHLLANLYVNNENSEIIDNFVEKNKKRHSFYEFIPKTSMEIMSHVMNMDLINNNRIDNSVINLLDKNAINLLDNGLVNNSNINLLDNNNIVDNNGNTNLLNNTNLVGNCNIVNNNNIVNNSNSNSNIVNNNNGKDNTFEEIEKALIFTIAFSYGKTYTIAKNMFSWMEAQQLKYYQIPENITPLTDDLRTKCSLFIHSLSSNPKYSVFVDPVNVSAYRNYLEIVRFPICFSDINKLLRNEDKNCYQSFEALIIYLKRISRNCIKFNSGKSNIGLLARELDDQINEFYNSNVKDDHQSCKTRFVISNIINESKICEFNPDFDINVDNLVFWGDLIDKINVFKRKHSKSSIIGRGHHISLGFIQRQLLLWFCIDGNRILCF